VAAFFVPVPRFATVAGRAGVTFVGAFRAVVVLAAVVFFAVAVLAVVVFFAAVFLAGTVLAAAVLRVVAAFVAGVTPAAAAVLVGLAALAVVFFAVVFFAVAVPVALRLAAPPAATVFFAAARGAAGVFVACFAAAKVGLLTGQVTAQGQSPVALQHTLSSVSTRLFAGAGPTWRRARFHPSPHCRTATLPRVANSHENSETAPQ
jgi:hypothetical protein